MNSEVKPLFFSTQMDFREWLEKNHNNSAELYVGFWKVKSGKPSMILSESVDQALCFGWIDGLRKSIDDESYYIRFTPRKSKSIWSTINIRKVEYLIEQGLMKPQGLALFNLREKHKTGIYSYENDTYHLTEEFEARFKTNKVAWDYYMSLPPSYRKPAIKWVMSAKQATTREKRLTELITDSEAGRKIKSLTINSSNKR